MPDKERITNTKQDEIEAVLKQRGARATSNLRRLTRLADSMQALEWQLTRRQAEERKTKRDSKDA